MNNKNYDQKSEIILGIDPGYDRLGWAIAIYSNNKYSQVKFGCIQTNRHQDIIQRYQQIEDDLQQLIDLHQPTQAAVETLFFANNVTTAMKVAETRGIILALLMRNKLDISQYNPMQIKEAVTGNGQADKKAVEKMVKMEFKFNDKKEKVIDDAIDALAVIFTHCLLKKNMKYYA